MKFVLSLTLLLSTQVVLAAGFTLKTSSFDAKKPLPMKQVFNGFGCTGENISPALEWSGAPKDTKSFAITVYDPDAPTGSGWWHWTVVNIPATVTKIEEGASNNKKLPEGSIEGRTDYGKPGFGGACPPPGDKPHRYIFTVYALKTDKLDVNAESSGALVGFNLNANSLGKATFTVKYGR
ncbi:YbhB/YbcL family Raf kinase inhibitor-like protein [Peredibacter starrii]|uniref:YbhB/YbcL family Raf kinase inhibitor-like protein n=1 Tax=Peredibacter starrii TaxID=28202 RepID=A0AAX4HLQ5_9BACT|nr:YbhB/YbcL family Raf kinase inhibitor-like protein [Peredibacter starrii]WPU64141.1 YbhB/YbcL family Raf kinase inhibitor-like protein [Peredibacter starrii]